MHHHHRSLPATPPHRRQILAVMLLLLALVALGVSAWRWHPHAAICRVDLNNRVIGARLQQDGISPYFYQWQSGDPWRYHDPFRIAGPVSNRTATPFYHRVLQVISNQPLEKISIIHFYSHYAAALAAILLFGMCSRRWLPTALAACVLAALSFTSWWKLQVLLGQYYLMFPLLVLATACLGLSRHAPIRWLGLVICAVLILFKPSALIWAMAWLAVQPKRWLRAFALLLLVAAGISVSGDGGSGWALWKDYRQAVAMHADRTLTAKAASSPVAAGKAEAAAWREPDWLAPISNLLLEENARTETSGLYGILHAIHPPLMTRGIIWGGAVLVLGGLLAAVAWQYRRLKPSQVLLAGALALVLSDFFVPVYRNGYYGLQWMAPLLLAIIVAWQTRRQHLLWFLPLWFGFLYWRPIWIPMRVTLAEGLLILFLLWLTLWPANQQEAGDPEDAIKALSA